MGLELVEIVLDVEDTFGFTIDEKEAGGLESVGDLYDYILAHRFHGYKEDCLSSVTFYRLRRVVMSILGVAREKVWPSTQLSELIPARRRRTWRKLQNESGLRLPDLQRPRLVTTIATTAAIVSGVAVPWSLSLSLMRGAILTAGLTMAAVGVSLAWLTKPLAFEFYSDCRTMGQLTSLTLALNFHKIDEESNRSASDEEVWLTLQTIVAENLGMNREDVTKETTFKELNAV